MRIAFLMVLGVSVIALGSAPPAGGRDYDTAPALPAPAGTIVDVDTVAELEQAVASLQSNTTIRIAAGTYDLTRTLYVGDFTRGAPTLANVAIRGATGDPTQVVIRGRGMSNASFGDVPSGIVVGDVNGILIADLTIRAFYHHPIQLAGEAGCRAPRIYNCRLVDAGEQFIKGSAATPGDGCDDGVVEYTLMEYTTTARSDYTNGVDVHGGANWVIRHNLFRRIREPNGSALAGPAVLMWRRSAGTIVEGNTFIACSRGIVFGLEDIATNDSHTGGVIRNNFFYRSGSTSGDVGIAVWESPGTEVYNNTVILSGTYPNAIEYRFNTSNVAIRGNLCDAAINDRGHTGTTTVSNNVVNAQSAWFVDAARGNLRLSSSAPATVVDAAPSLASVTDDFDGLARPGGSAPDMGASEFRPGGGDTTAPTVTIDSPTAAATFTTTSDTIALGGTADDNVGVTGVSWANSRGGSGPASGTTAWTASGIALQPGQNVLAVTARDAAGNAATDSLTVTYDTPPLLVVRAGRALTAGQFAPGAVRVPAFQVELAAGSGDDVDVRAIRFGASGTLDDAANVTEVRLFEDTDADGRVDAAERAIATGGRYGTDDGTVFFGGLSERIAAGTSVFWIAAYDLAAAAPDGATFATAVEQSGDVTATAAATGSAVPVNLAGATGPTHRVSTSARTGGGGGGGGGGGCAAAPAALGAGTALAGAEPWLAIAAGIAAIAARRRCCRRRR